jgi:uncharacterized protein YqeY
MSLQEEITAALRTGMRGKDQAVVTSVRLLLTAMKKREKEVRRPLAESEILAVISSEIKQRHESIEQYRMAAREDLAATEESELRVLQRFMPEQLSEEELARVVDGIIAEVGAVSVKDMGKVMKLAMTKLAGRADGRAINLLVKERLTP